ncbi:MAG: hypothetical protein ACOYKD_07830 [Anaerolineaceae bacterium]|jgi:hypothetical protein
MSDYRAKITQAETVANGLIDELEKLKVASKDFHSSSDSFEKVSNKLDQLITKQQSIADAQLSLLKSMDQLGLAEQIRVMTKQHAIINRLLLITNALILCLSGFLIWALLFK